LVRGGGGTLAGERGGGRVPVPTRGHAYTVVLLYFLASPPFLEGED
jgi:hypothetical protein